MKCLEGKQIKCSLVTKQEPKEQYKNDISVV